MDAPNHPSVRTAPPSALVKIEHEGLLPLKLARWVRPHRQALFVARDESMLRMLLGSLPAFLDGVAIVPLPAWDSMPYERARPSRAVTGQRVRGLARLATEREAPVLVVTTPEALTQRTPPPGRFIERAVLIQSGQTIDPEWLRATLEAFGYQFADSVDEPGDAVMRAGVVDIHPAGAPVPVRLEIEDSITISIRHFDSVTQRSSGSTGSVLLLPASEGFTVPGEKSAPTIAERLLPDGPLATLFDFLPDAAIACVAETQDRINDWLELVREAHQTALATMRTGQAPPLPDRLYLREDECWAGLNGAITCIVGSGSVDPPVALSAAARLATARLKEGDAVIVCADTAPVQLRSAIARRLRVPADDVAELPHWKQAERSPPGSVGTLRAALPGGFRLNHRSVIAVQTFQAPPATPMGANVFDLRVGDLVIEPEYGLARLTGLALEEAGGAPFECLALQFLGGSQRLVPAQDAARVWRYGASASVALDRLEGSAWQQRKAELQRQIEAAAAALVREMRARAARAAPVIEPAAQYRTFVRRLPFPLTLDQTRAIRDVQQDLASGHPMLRLVCGDVGFGKTEVALHAAAVAALGGYQVAVAAPTTLLARQHLATFRRRLQGFGLRIEPLIRTTRTAQARQVLNGLGSGQVDIVIGTQAVAAARFAKLGLVVIDEEQRFGETQKRALREKRAEAHCLIMTATPLPRTLQAGLVGIVGVSVLTQPPAARLPIRTAVLPFEPVTVRTALLHEARRGGQSFVVCPRIEDIAPMHARLAEIVPELEILVAHGRMRGETLDETMLRFAEGAAPVLLTTNIVESGLDIPNANTMLVWRADRFGLAQLHQLRGRIGRGRVRASAYFFTDPDRPPSRLACKRLEAIAAHTHLGAGFALSLADLDQRGAGDLLGEDQAGHIRIIGTELYRHMLDRALRRARGEAMQDDWLPDLALDIPAFIPVDVIPEADTRLQVYRMLARLETLDAVEEAVEELTDRFGALPAPVMGLLAAARLRVLCRMLEVAAVHAGPRGLALTPRPGAQPPLHSLDATESGGRLVVHVEGSGLPRLEQLIELLKHAAEELQRDYSGTGEPGP